MGPPSGTLHALARHLALAVQPLEAAVADLPAFRTLLYRLAWDAESLPPEYTALAAKAEAAVAAVEELGESPEPAQVLEALDRVRALYGAVNGLTTAPAGVDAPAFLAEISRGLFDLLLSDYLNQAFPALHAALLALDVLSQRHVEERDGRPAALLTRFRWEEIPGILTDPASIATRVYGWGTDDVDFHRLAGHLLELFVARDWPAYMERVETALGRGFQDAPDTLAASIEWALKVPVLLDNIGGREVEVGLALLELPAQGGRPAGLILRPLVPAEVGTRHEIAEGLTLELRAGSDAGATFGILLRPDEVTVRFPLQAGAVLPDTGFGATLRYAPDEPAVLLGAPGATRLELARVAMSFTVDVREGQIELRLEAAPEDLTLVVAAGDLDGFLARVLGSRELRVPVACRVGWSSRSGLSFTAGAGFAVSVYPHLALGPVTVDRFDLGVVTTLGDPPDLAVEAAVTLSGALGPVAFAVDAMGLRLACRFQDGNAGPFDLDFGFKPPAGVGIVIDTGPVTGGGFLAFDPANGRYTGILELQVYTVAVTAIGILETRLPGGGSGYSFLIVIAADIPPVQVGFGFTLTAVGGLAGINRTMLVEAARAGLQDGSLDRLMFPEDPVRNAARIVSDLRTVFPPADGRHLFGPMFKLVWGTPILLRADIALILEVPDPVRLLVLGRVAIALPTEEERIVDLHVDFVGVVDFGAKLLAVDATLRDSRVVAWPISGDMAARLSWGAQKSLAIALGGLNPHFTPPPGFPSLRRLTIAFGRGDNPRLTMQAYLALTSNSRQIGARVELYAAAGGFSIHGWVAFDALLSILPFRFTADLSAGVALRRGTRTIAGVHLDATLTGPLPMRARGKACLSLFFFDICVPFDVTVGDAIAEILSRIDPWPLLRAAIADARSWTTALLAGTAAVASVAVPRGAPRLPLVEPMGGLTLRQTVVPLNRTIERFGEVALERPTAYTVQTVSMSGSAQPAWSEARDDFAPGQFHALSDAERLSRPSFEPMAAGVTVGDGAVALGTVMGLEVVYETRIVDEPWEPPRPAPRYHLGLLHQLASLEQGAAARAGLRTTGLERFAPRPGRPPRVALDDDGFVIVSVEDLTPLDGGPPAGRGAALDALRRHEAAHPEDRGRFQVIAVHELEPA